MLESVCPVKLCKLLQSTEAFCAPFPLLDFKFFNPLGAFWRKWKHVLKAFEGSRGTIDVQLPKSHQ